MNPQLVQNLVTYISQTNTALGKYASALDERDRMMQKRAEEMQIFNEKLAEAIEVLAKEGSIPALHSEAIYSSLRDNPVKVAEFLKNVNNRPQKMGEASSGLHANNADPMVAFCFG